MSTRNQKMGLMRTQNDEQRGKEEAPVSTQAVAGDEGAPRRGGGCWVGLRAVGGQGTEVTDRLGLVPYSALQSPLSRRVTSSSLSKMPLEATVIVIDNSEYMRNGDYVPTRFEAQSDAVTTVFGHKVDSNPENTVGLMSMAGKGYARVLSSAYG